VDPIISAVIAILMLVILLRIFFGVAKMFLKLAIILVIAIVLWRVFFLKG